MPSNDVEDEIPDVLPSLLNGTPFKLKSEAEKLRIISSGRPTPRLSFTRRDSNRNSNRGFQDSWYDAHQWLCGSKTYNKLFCWPCSLMRPETSSWCSTGTDDMKKFPSLASKHSGCKSHLKAIAEYDETLLNFNMAPEFETELKLKCKEEETSAEFSDVDDSETRTFCAESKNQNSSETMLLDDSSKSYEEGTKTSTQLNKPKYKITFRNWQDMKRDDMTCTSLTSLETMKLYKWKRKKAKQDFRNARLEGEKLKFEIEALKAKIDYYRGLKSEYDSKKGSASIITH